VAGHGHIDCVQQDLTSLEWFCLFEQIDEGGYSGGERFMVVCDLPRGNCHCEQVV